MAGYFSVITLGGRGGYPALPPDHGEGGTPFLRSVPPGP